MIHRTSERLSLKVSGGAISIDRLCDAILHPGRWHLEPDDALHQRMQPSVDLVQQAVDNAWTVYGVTTGFGGMAGVPIPAKLASASQNNLLSFLAAGAGDAIDPRHVRGAMLLRANVLARGKSGVRPEIVERLIRFFNAGMTPVVRELGSIGASGDLVPLSTIGRAITGQPEFVRVRVGDRELEGAEALEELGYDRLDLRPKEGLAIVNGTSFSSSIAANSVFEAKRLMAITLGAQAMMLQALMVQEEPFDDYVHRHKPHPGQRWTAAIMRRLLREGRENANGKPIHVQDRYSLRCLPQYMGPIIEGIKRVGETIETEMNSVSDNPLVDGEEGCFHQSGNFLGQYVAIAMDDLRRFIGLMAKHLDVQIAALMAPEFSSGLPASLRGTDNPAYNMGLKGLQITGNSIMPMLTYFGNPLVEHYPTHAEQFNQNINGLSWGAANLAWRSVDLFRHYLTVALMCSVQAADLRAKSTYGHFDGRCLLGTLAAAIYESVCDCLSVTPGGESPLLLNDRDRWLEQDLAALYDNLVGHDSIVQAIEPILESFQSSLD